MLRRCKECAVNERWALAKHNLRKTGRLHALRDASVPQQEQKQVNSHSNSPPGQK